MTEWLLQLKFTLHYKLVLNHSNRGIYKGHTYGGTNLSTIYIVIHFEEQQHSIRYLQLFIIYMIFDWPSNIKVEGVQLKHVLLSSKWRLSTTPCYSFFYSKIQEGLGKTKIYKYIYGALIFPRFEISMTLHELPCIFQAFAAIIKCTFNKKKILKDFSFLAHLLKFTSEVNSIKWQVFSIW